MIVVTHEMRFAREVSDPVAFFREELIHELGTPRQIFDSPQRSETADFSSVEYLTSLMYRFHYDFAAEQVVIVGSAV